MEMTASSDPSSEDPGTSSPNPSVPSRAACQILAERTGVIAPGAPLSDELMAFAEAVAKMALRGGVGDAGTG
jgi:hypothetical protein